MNSEDNLNTVVDINQFAERHVKEILPNICDTELANTVNILVAKAKRQCEKRARIRERKALDRNLDLAKVMLVSKEVYEMYEEKQKNIHEMPKETPSNITNNQSVLEPLSQNGFYLNVCPQQQVLCSKCNSRLSYSTSKISNNEVLLESTSNTTVQEGLSYDHVKCNNKYSAIPFPNRYSPKTTSEEYNSYRCDSYNQVDGIGNSTNSTLHSHETNYNNIIQNSWTQQHIYPSSQSKYVRTRSETYLRNRPTGKPMMQYRNMPYRSHRYCPYGYWKTDNQCTIRYSNSFRKKNCNKENVQYYYY